MLYEFKIETQKNGFTNVTAQVADAVRKSGVTDGICVVYCPHTTAAITINENADPDVVRDMMIGLDAAFPERPDFRHNEGNSSAHLKSSCVGASETVIVCDGELMLGTWQGIYFCEFDGPRARRYYVRVLG